MVRSRVVPVVIVLVTSAAAAALVQAQTQPAETPDPAITDGSAARALERARARWRAHGPASYRFRVRHTCFCPQEYTRERTITVRGGRPIRPPGPVANVATVPRLFRVVRTAIKDGAAQLDVTYDRRYGYPRSIYVDRVRMIADEESGYRARYLKPLR